MIAFLGSVLTRKTCFSLPLAAVMSSSTLSDGFPATRPIPSNVSQVHVVVLVHGWLGNPQELGHLHSRIEKEAEIVEEQNPKSFHLIHSARCNYKRTTDGIAAGGKRLAEEVNELIQTVPQNSKITLSFVGNSLGGLYSRYALSLLPSLDPIVLSSQKVEKNRVTPRVFWTTCTPHLGVSEHTYIQLPRWIEGVVAKVLSRTGEDLFRRNNVIQYLVTYERYWKPLSYFQHRIAHVNSYATDFQVPTATAGFLVDNEEVNHYRRTDWEEPSHVEIAVETLAKLDALQSIDESDAVLSKEEIAQRLDALGWIKVFCDVRTHLPYVSLPFSKPTEPVVADAKEFSSLDLKQRFAGLSNGTWHVPIGHTVLVANSKNDFYSDLNAAGKPYMDILAKDLVRLLNE